MQQHSRRSYTVLALAAVLVILIIAAEAVATLYVGGGQTTTSQTSEVVTAVTPSVSSSTQTSSSSTSPSTTSSTASAQYSTTQSSSTKSQASQPSTQTSASSASTSSSSSSSSSSVSAASSISHVIVLVMENEEFGSVIGSASAPYQNKLASTYALADSYFAVAHPSLPNYLAMVAGSTFGVSSDCLPSQCNLPAGATTVASLFDARGLSWKDYSESMPSTCSQVNSQDGLYFPKHNPFVYFKTVTGNDGSGSTSDYCNSHVVSLDQFWVDLQSGRLPNYSFIAPNICNDAHSCSLSTGDRWLSTVVPRITSSSSFASTALFIVYDEGTTNSSFSAAGSGGGGQVPLVLVSPFAKQGYISHVSYSHYSLLATVETIFNLGTLGRQDAGAAPVGDLFSPSARIP